MRSQEGNGTIWEVGVTPEAPGRVERRWVFIPAPAKANDDNRTPALADDAASADIPANIR